MISSNQSITRRCTRTGAYAGFSEGGCREGGGVPRSAKEANNPILLKVQSLQLSFRPAGVSLGGGGGAKAPPGPPPPCVRPWRILPCTLGNNTYLWTAFLGVTKRMHKLKGRGSHIYDEKFLISLRACSQPRLRSLWGLLICSVCV